MLHSLVVLNDDQYVLLARYFQPQLTLDARRQFETHLARVCTQHGGGSGVVDQLLCCENQFVVVRQMGELRVLLAGNDEYDELLLTEMLALIHAVLLTQLEKKLTEASLLANYAKVVAAVDEMVQQGHWETTDEPAIEQMSKLRPYPVK
ncbi:hypothetical protein Poli38472_010831 [Pythium oligandrum]|uniref:Coatomer subunit zeta n=1 Tax=Pythium oligandrum TaxID=41045 RepID=A0A8K1FKI8_PYTOL|nr:hypothetical protein Poli38472_010831 [Pythium oligandrum]|eukprot:TMW61768.1 hypothetical protein Poli38472_010831 [Pythium oligandrum]